ncbi:MAG: hypothetical protein K1563_13915 [Candidatus Thiodiazotropha sp. (ex. Lucinisca nassula)]|nr:hypothetical protein [Candidatus Thiodiazotropha sp. (ex. Lucinisca nassula)]
MSSEIDNYIKELRHTVTVAGLNYEIWWVYKSEDTRPKYVGAMNQYSLFFQVSTHAHFVTLLVELYRLYETRNDTYNIPSLINKLKMQNLIEKNTLMSLENTYKEEAKPLWVKVNILRNKAFGHRSEAHTVEEVFQEANVKPLELKKLVEVTQKLLNELTLALNQSYHAFNLGARKDTLKLLDDLETLRNG